MGTDVAAKGLVFTNARPLFTDGEGDVSLDPLGARLIVFGLPGVAEVTRMGDSWQVCSSAGIAAQTALPTTTAGLSLWNGDPTKTYVIDSCGFWQAVVDATNDSNHALFVMNNSSPIAAPTDAALTIRSTVGKRYGGKARTLAGGTVTNDGWFAAGTTSNIAEVAVAGNVWGVYESTFTPGLYQVPPGGMFNIAGLSFTTTPGALGLFYYVRWHEVKHGGIVS